VALLALLSGALADNAQVVLSGTIDANWRGSYDILVRSAGAALPLEATGGLVEPNFLAFSGRGGISIDELERVRALPGVDLAAPVGFVGYLAWIASAPTVQLDILPNQPTLYEVAMTATTSDGLTNELIQHEVGHVLLGPVVDDPNAPSWATDLHDLGYGTDGSGRVIVDFSLHPLPPIPVPILAVDPVAEARLLGSGGAFLDPFSNLVGRSSLTVGNVDPSLVPSPYRFAADILKTLNDPRYHDPRAKNRPILPVVLSAKPYGNLHIALSISQIGQPLSAYPGEGPVESRLAAAQTMAGPGEHHLGTSELDATPNLRLFQPTNLALPWPGSSSAGAPVTAGGTGPLRVEVAGRPTYQSIMPRWGSSAPSFRIMSQGTTGPALDLATTSQSAGVQVGRFPAYRRFDSLALATGGATSADSLLDAPFALFPIGSFDLTSVDRPYNPLDYVPLGAYRPPDTRLVADASGAAASPVAMSAGLNPAGLIAEPPLAITDLGGATLLRGDRPIDAIRVRVAGLSGFGPGDRSRVEGVAASIRRLGLDVDVVAGSSPQRVEIYVPAYNVSSSPTSDLGWVEQQWTTLGAAQRVETAFGSANVILVGLAGLVSAVLLAGVGALEIANRRAEVATLRAIGWSRRRIVSWVGSEALLVAGLIAGAAGVGWLAGSRSLGALFGGLGLAVIAVLAGAGETLVATQAPFTAVLARDVIPRERGAFRVDSVLGLVIRSITHRAGILAEFIPLTVAGSTAGIAGAILAGAAGWAGPTLLAEAVAGSISPLQAGLLVCSAIAALSFALAVGVLAARARLRDFQILEATGWAPSAMQRLTLGLVGIVALPAAAAAAGIAALGATLLQAPGFAAVVVAVVVVAACGLVSLAALRRALPRE
jgi:hypothetical protein